MKRNGEKGAGMNLGVVFTMVLFVFILISLYLGLMDLSSGTSEEGEAATRQALERAAVLCYATEGFYPPGLDYIKENYGVHIDENTYLVRYEVYASNVMPVIRVVKR